MSSLKLRPLAMGKMDGRRVTLSATEAQDQYYVVFTNGDHKKISVLEAVRFYLEASKDENNLVWLKAAKRREAAMAQEAKPKDTANDPVAAARQWRNDLRSAFDLPPLEANES